MGVYTDTILLENQARLNDIKEILYSDKSGSCFVDLLKHKLNLCSKEYAFVIRIQKRKLISQRSITRKSLTNYPRSFTFSVSIVFIEKTESMYRSTNICKCKKQTTTGIVG